MTNKALPGRGFLAARREFRLYSESRKGPFNPLVNLAIAFFRAEGMPFVSGWEGETVCPVRIMRYQSTAGGPTDERSQQSGLFNFRKVLEITKGCRRLRPTVAAQQGGRQPGAGFEQRLIQRHVECSLTRSGVEKVPVHFTPIRGQSCASSQSAQSGFRAPQRRRPCQMSQ